LPRRLTIEFIRSEFEKEGYKLLSTKYINTKQKLEYICPNGHKHKICWSKWQQKQRCYYCGDRVTLNIQDIRREFEKYGYQLLSSTYKNNYSKLEYLCPSGHKNEISWISFSRGNRCSYCFGNKKLTIEYVRERFNNAGYKLLSKKYINANHKLEYNCPNGHRRTITWADFNTGKRCAECYGKIKLTIEKVKLEFEKEEYTLLSKVYESSQSKLDYICKGGHRGKLSWNSFQRGHRCKKCYHIRCTRDWSQEKVYEFNKYKKCVAYISDKNYKKYRYIINSKNLERGHFKYHIDHIYSIYDGFINKIDPKIIASPINLRMMKWSANISKNKRSHISIKKLNEEYLKFINRGEGY